MAIEDWLEDNIDSKIKYTTGSKREAHFNCPICGEYRKRMYVNLDSGKVFCHNCGYSSSVVGLIQFIEGISWSSAQLKFKDIHGLVKLPQAVSSEISKRILSGAGRGSLDKRPIPLPEEFIPLKANTSSLVEKKALRYLSSRGIEPYLAEQLNFGICLEGDYKNRIIIPITENGHLRFWVARSFYKGVKLKEKSPSNEHYQISKSEVIFNIDRAAKNYHSIVITEGIFDALSYSDIGVSLLGKSLSQEQFRIIMDYKELLFNGIYISLDNDASEQSSEIAHLLAPHFDVYLIEISRELDDPNNAYVKMGSKFMLDLIANAKSYEEFSGIKSRLQKIR